MQLVRAARATVPLAAGRGACDTRRVPATCQTPDPARPGAGADVGPSEAALKARIDELERSNADLERFAGIASHDLQAPLRVVSGFVELLRRRYEGQLDDQADEFIRRTLDGVARMRQLTDDLLAHARVAGEAPEAMEDVDTAALVHEVLDSLGLLGPQALATVQVGELPVVRGRRSQLAQLFQNLLSNAVKFAGDKTPHVRIGAVRDGEYWRFAVQDDGIGIDEDARHRVFDLFERMHPGDRYPGNGIGLAICKRIVDRHGGQISADAAPGGGTLVSFTLPAG